MALKKMQLVLLAALACARLNGATLEEVARSEVRWTGVAVSKAGRLFVNFPRWGKIACSVAEIVQGKAVAFPGAGWNLWEEGAAVGERFVCVQSVHVDGFDRLWALDAGASLQSGVIAGAPKLVMIDLKTNAVARVYPFGPAVATGASYLNDVRVDTRSNFAFMTESGQGALVVLDLTSGEARRRLDGRPSTRAEEIELQVNGRAVRFPVHADGIALTPDGQYLYFKALAGRALYRVPTARLRDFALDEARLEAEVELVAATLPSDGMEFDRWGNLYLTAIEKNAVYRLAPDRSLAPLVVDERLAWPDSLAVGPGGRLYMTNSAILFPAGTRFGLFSLLLGENNGANRP
jgi:sugar lactone lactonase YvrE